MFKVIPNGINRLDMKKFDRAAVLTDKTWLKKVSEFEGVLYPGLEIKAFNRDQKAEAEAWLSSQVDIFR